MAKYKRIAPPLPSLSPAERASRRVEYATFLVEEAQRMGIKGFKPHHGAAMVGDMDQESGMRSDSRPEYKNAGQGYGLIHWMNNGGKYNRFAHLKAFAAEHGQAWSHDKTQLKFMLHEMFGKPEDGHGGGSEASAGKRLLKTASIGAASTVVSKGYVRPLPETANYAKRFNDGAIALAGMMKDLPKTLVASLGPTAVKREEKPATRNTEDKPQRKNYKALAENKPQEHRQNAVARERSRYRVAANEPKGFFEMLFSNDREVPRSRSAVRSQVARDTVMVNMQDTYPIQVPAAPVRTASRRRPQPVQVATYDR